MIKHYSQVLVLIGVCMAWGQGITEVIDNNGKDSAIAISDSSVVSGGAISKNDAAATVTAKDTTGVVPKDTTEVIGDILNSDSAKGASNNIVVDTAKPKVSEPVLTAVEATPEKNEENHPTFGGRSGIGINMMAKVFYSEEINTFFEDVYDKWIDDVPGTIKSKSEFSPLVSVVGVNLKGVIYVGPVVGLEPFGCVSFGKSMYIVRDHDHEVDISLVDVGGGVNIWARVAPKKRVSFKAGLGGYVCYSTLDVDGYAGEVQFTGVGYGVNILAGIDITLRKLAVNIDFLLPVGETELNQHGTFNQIGSNRTIRYPSEYVHTGLVIRPGVTFQF